MSNFSEEQYIQYCCVFRKMIPLGTAHIKCYKFLEDKQEVSITVETLTWLETANKKNSIEITQEQLSKNFTVTFFVQEKSWKQSLVSRYLNK